MRPTEPAQPPDDPPDSLAPTTVALDPPEAPVTLELIQLVEEVIPRKRGGDLPPAL